LIAQRWAAVEQPDFEGGVGRRKKLLLSDLWNWCAHSKSCSARIEALNGTFEIAAIVEPLTLDQRE
jgi:hypothetical protein